MKRNTRIDNTNVQCFLPSLSLSLFFSLSLSLVIFLFSGNAFASSPYKLNTQNEVIYLGTGAAMALTGYINEGDRAAPTEADISSLNKNDIPGFERRFAGKWNKDAHNLSDIMLVTGVLSPLPLLFSNTEDYFTLGVMYLETYALAGGGMALSKGSVTRYRPLAYGDKAPLSEKLGHDTKRSFFSGHAALTASGLIFSASVFSDYYPDSKYKSAIWTTAITGSIATGLLRIEAGKHFPSDVITGLAWGGAVGYLIPRLHRKERDFILFPFANSEQQGISFIKYF